MLICQSELFSGMEADSVVYCVHDFHDTFLRADVTRACSKLNIVYSYLSTYRIAIDFLGSKLDPSFMRCEEVVFELDRFTCLTCEDIAKKLGNNEKDGDRILICRSCSMGCHHGHEMKQIVILDNYLT